MFDKNEIVSDESVEIALERWLNLAKASATESSVDNYVKITFLFFITVVVHYVHTRYLTTTNVSYETATPAPSFYGSFGHL